MRAASGSREPVPTVTVLGTQESHPDCQGGRAQVSAGVGWQLNVRPGRPASPGWTRGGSRCSLFTGEEVEVLGDAYQASIWLGGGSWVSQGPVGLCFQGEALPLAAHTCSSWNGHHAPLTPSPGFWGLLPLARSLALLPLPEFTAYHPSTPSGWRLHGGPLSLAPSPQLCSTPQPRTKRPVPAPPEQPAPRLSSSLGRRPGPGLPPALKLHSVAASTTPGRQAPRPCPLLPPGPVWNEALSEAEARAGPQGAGSLL